jgi:hypothetical protein
MRNDKLEVSMKHNTKGRKRTVLLFVSLLLLLTAGGICFTFRDVLANHYYLTMKSPEDYYAYIEQLGLYRLSSIIPEDTSVGREAFAYNISSDLILHKDKLNSVMDTVLDLRLSDIEEQLGISLDTISLETLLTRKDDKIKHTLGMDVNNTSILSSELFLDLSSYRMFLRLPRLSNSYLTDAIDGSINQPEEPPKELLTADLIKAIFVRYMKLYLENLGSVTLEHKVPLDLKHTVIDSNVVTVSFTGEELLELSLTLLDDARTDPDILSLLPMFHTTTEQYQLLLNRAKEYILNRYSESDWDEVYQQMLYVDGHGQILRREFKTLHRASFGYTAYAQENSLEYEFFLSHPLTNRTLLISGTNRCLEGYNQGNIDIYVKDPILPKYPEVKLDISYEDVRRCPYQGHYYLEGAFTLASKELEGILITSDFEYRNGRQHNTTDIRLGTSPLITFDSTGSFQAVPDLTEPEPDANRYAFSRYKEYLNSIDLDGYLISLSKGLGINSDTLYELLGYDIR